MQADRARIAAQRIGQDREGRRRPHSKLLDEWLQRSWRSERRRSSPLVTILTKAVPSARRQPR
jgi:hypothetical protein